MDRPDPDRRLAATLEALRAAGIVPAAADRLQASSTGLTKALFQSVTGEIPAFTDSGNPDVLPELRQQLDDHVSEIIRLLAGGRIGDGGFVAAHAERRAEQKFPLDATLHAYRAMHRVLLSHVRDAALSVADKDAHVNRVVAAVTDFVTEYTGAAGTLTTSRYVEHTRRLAEAEGDRRTELLNTLLDGFDESDRRAALLLQRASYLQQRQSYCVAVAQSVDPAEMESAPRTQRIVDALNKVLANSGARLVAGVRDDLVTAVISGTRRVSGWTAPQTRLADLIEPELLKLGPAVLIGLSSDQPSTSHIPKALREARIALEFASVTRRVVPFAKLPIRKLLLHLGGEQVKPALPGWTEDFVKADARAKGKLVATLRGYAAADMNVLQAARDLDVHPNTIYSRMQRIEKVTGLDGQRFDALNDLLLAAELGALVRTDS